MELSPWTVPYPLHWSMQCSDGGLGCTHSESSNYKYCSYSYVENTCRLFQIVNAIGCICFVRITVGMYLVVQAVQVCSLYISGFW